MTFSEDAVSDVIHIPKEMITPLYVVVPDVHPAISLFPTGNSYLILFNDHKTANASHVITEIM